MSAAYTERRVVGPGDCTWCGHPPHAATCPNQIQVNVINKKPVLEPCSCAVRRCR